MNCFLFKARDFNHFIFVLLFFWTVIKWREHWGKKQRQKKNNKKKKVDKFSETNLIYPNVFHAAYQHSFIFNMPV